MSTEQIDSAGPNWIESLQHFASVSGLLAGFCVTFITIIIGASFATTKFIYEITYGQVSVLLFGIATGLFIFTSQRFLHALECSPWNLTEDYIEYRLKVKKGSEKWIAFLKRHDEQCQAYEKEARIAYDFGIWFMLFGLYSIITPYNQPIAIVALIAGSILEIWQYLK